MPAIDALRERSPSEVGETLGRLLPPDEPGSPTPGDLPVQGGRTLPIFVMGAGRGGVARDLTRLIAEHDLDTRCVIVETDPLRMLATLLRDDWSPVLAEDRTRFALGSDIPASLQEALPEESDPLLEPVLSPAIRLVRSDELPHALEIENDFRREALAHAEGFRTRCREQTAKRDAADTPLSGRRWRIWSSVGAGTSALKHLAPSILGAAGRSGHEGIVDVTDSEAPFTSSGLSRRAFDVDPDLVLSFLKPGRTLAPWRRDMPGIVLVSSNPDLLPIRTFEWSDRDLVVLADPSFEPTYRELGVDPVVRPLATDIPDPAGLDEIESPPCDVLAVGSIPDARHAIGDLPREVHDRLRELGETWMEHPTTTAMELLESEMIPAPDAIRPRLPLALAYEATRLRRIRSALVLAEAGFRIRIHGDEAWREVLKGTAAEGCWHGWLPAGREQFAAFRRAPVTINVNHFAAPDMLNMRALEVPAAGGVLVTDDRPVLRRSFEVGREVLAFDRVEELPDLVSGILADDRRRGEIAAAGRDRTIRDHSWDAWWTWVEAELRRRFG